jgi:hypothetical protein
MNSPRKLPLLAILTVAAMGSCAPVENAVLGQAMSMAANDQIMLISKEPASFGYLRLESQAREFPDLGVFISRRGLPDFLAETKTDGRKYFILYYLKVRQAYACRTSIDSKQAVEFSGPYPITDKEFGLLDGFRRDPTQAQKKIQSQ